MFSQRVLLGFLAATATLTVHAEISAETDCETKSTEIETEPAAASLSLDKKPLVVHNDKQPLYMAFTLFVDHRLYMTYLSQHDNDVEKTLKFLVERGDNRSTALMPIMDQLTDEFNNSIKSVLMDIVIEISPASTHNLTLTGRSEHIRTMNWNQKLYELFGHRTDQIVIITPGKGGLKSGCCGICYKERNGPVYRHNAVLVGQFNLGASVDAHEIGHNFHMKHDVDVGCEFGHVMSGSYANYSSCSKQKAKEYIKHLLDANKKSGYGGVYHNCLLDNPYRANDCKCHDKTPEVCRKAVRKSGCGALLKEMCSKGECNYTCDVCDNNSGKYCKTESKPEKCENKRRRAWTLGENYEFKELPY